VYYILVDFPSLHQTLSSLHQNANKLLPSSNEYAQLEGKKTIQPADVIAALKENEFEHFIPRLEAELKSITLPPLPYPNIPKLTQSLQKNTTQSNATNETPTAARSAKKKRQNPVKTVNPQTVEQKTEM
jgi:hypothetical protein